MPAWETRGKYRLREGHLPRFGFCISRADVTDCLIRTAEDRSHVGKFWEQAIDRSPSVNCFAVHLVAESQLPKRHQRRENCEAKQNDAERMAIRVVEQP